MRPKFFPLYSEAEMNTPAAGGAPVEVAAVVESPVEAVTPVELSFGQKVMAAVRDKGALAADLQIATERANRAEGELLTLRADLQSVKTERDALALEKQGIADALAAAEKQAKTAEVAAVEVVASLGFAPVEAAELPGAQEPVESPIKGLEKQYAETTDPKEKYTIAQKIRAAMKAEG
jgi:chromosome segregation ATPase